VPALPLLLPPLAEQHLIVAKVDELLALCDRLKARIAAARAKHAQLAQALVAQALASAEVAAGAA
jgi:type I restriction enzyme S subunit